MSLFPELALVNPSPTDPISSRWSSRRGALWASLVAGGLLAAGCDPVVNFYGSFFPAWVLSLALGIFLTIIFRWVLAAIRLEPHLGPLLLIYPVLAFLLTGASWLVLFGP